MPLSVMLGLLLVLGPPPEFAAAPAGAPPASTPPGSATTASPTGEPTSRGTLLVTPPPSGSLRVTDGEGRVVATLAPSSRGEPARLRVRPGTYFIFDGRDEALAKIVMGAGGEARWRHPEAVEPPPAAPPPPPPMPALERPASAPAAEGSGDAPPDDVARPRWKRIAAPIFSAVVPGVGQMVNRQPGKGIGILGGVAALGIGLLVVDGLDARSTGQQVGLATMSAGLGYLYAWQIADAYVVAAGKAGDVTGRSDFKLRWDIDRLATIAPSGRYDGTDLYTDWTMSFMGQVFPRLTVGASDVSFKLDPSSDRVTFQFGARVGYRVVEKRRFWLGLSLGGLMQVTSAPDLPPPLGEEDEARGRELRFGGAPYGQLDLRVFVADRVSLNLIPRLSVPLETRFYDGDRALPRYAATFELGTGVGVVF